MPYCTPDDLRGLYKPLSEDTDTFDDPYLQRFITSAQRRIDNRLRVHYNVPLPDPVPGIINEICADWALSMVCAQHWSDVNYRDDTPLSEYFRRRAETELNHVIEEMTIDDEPGVTRKQPDVPEMRIKVASTTTGQSPLQRRLREFERQTRGDLLPLPGRWPY